MSFELKIPFYEFNANKSVIYLKTVQTRPVYYGIYCGEYTQKENCAQRVTSRLLALHLVMTLLRFQSALNAF